jgi:dihydroorotase-like cyclic amidohydrolase
MDLVLKNTRLPGRGDALADIAISSGEIAAIAPNITTVGPTVDAGGLPTV